MLSNLIEVSGLIGCGLIALSTYNVLGWYNIILMVGILMVVYSVIYRNIRDIL